MQVLKVAQWECLSTALPKTNFRRLLCLKLLSTGSEDPNRHEQEFLFYYLII
jgi:hypothetical protein